MLRPKHDRVARVQLMELVPNLLGKVDRIRDAHRQLLAFELIRRNVDGIRNQRRFLYAPEPLQDHACQRIGHCVVIRATSPLAPCITAEQEEMQRNRLG